MMRGTSSLRALALTILFAASLPAVAGGRAETADPPVRPAPVQGQVPPALEGAATAVFAGGCFWCMEEAFDAVRGVTEVVSGYAGGPEANPTYERVAYGLTGHTEVVRVYYDPVAVTYEELLFVFWRNVDPIDAGGQFCDRGAMYRTAVLYQTDEERILAERSRDELDASGRFNRSIVTEISPLKVIGDGDHDGFWAAEEYHQDYYLKNPLQYRSYKSACGRVRRLQQLWGSEAGAPQLAR